MAPVIAVPERLAPPKAVEVIPAGSVDARVTAIAVEIRQLEAEARDLDEEATRLERQAGESRRRVEESDSVLPMLEAVFGEHRAHPRARSAAAHAQVGEGGHDAALTRSSRAKSRDVSRLRSTPTDRGCG